MTIRTAAAAVLALTVALGARAADAPKPAAAPAHAGFEKVKKLAGTWVEADKDGKPTEKVVSVVKVIANGSTVHETFFPGTPMEMVSVYHLDKGELVMTHYCALGNQPRLKADPKAPANQLKWDFVGGTNLDVNKDMHMHSSVVTFVSDDRIEIAGEAWENGKPCPAGCGVMKLVRKK